LKNLYKDLSNFEIRGGICVEDSLTLEDQNITIRGAGFIHVKGTLTIQGNLTAPNVVLVASKIQTRADYQIQANLIQTSGKFQFTSYSYNGMVASEGLQPSIRNSRNIGLSYNSSF